MIDTLFVYYTHKPGGLCKRLYRAMNVCAERGDSVCYLTLDRPPLDLHSGVSVHLLPFPTRMRRGLLFWGLFTLFLPIYLFAFSLYRRPARIVTFGAYYAAAARPTQVLLGRKVILFLRSLTFKIDEITGKARWLRRITGVVDWWGIRGATCTIAMTKVMQREASEFSGRDLSCFQILPNDIEISTTEVTDTGSERECMILFAGVLDARKNVSVLLRAWKQLEAIGGNAGYQLRILGDGPERARLEQLATSLGVTRVHFDGWVSDQIPWLRRASLYLHPSIHEGVSNSILEALAARTAVIASDIPEHRELFSSNGAPDNLASVDSPEQWAEMIAAYCSDIQYQKQIQSLCEVTRLTLSFDWDRELYAITRL